jgi:cyclic pyranopterin phosphate synthase
MCLLREYEVDLLTPLRKGASTDQLQKLVLDAIWNKPWGRGLSEELDLLRRPLNEIGG